MESLSDRLQNVSANAMRWPHGAIWGWFECQDANTWTISWGCNHGEEHEACPLNPPQSSNRYRVLNALEGVDTWKNGSCFLLSQPLLHHLQDENKDVDYVSG